MDSANKERHSTGTRRRGDALEADILRAVWEELSEVGYVRLTMEGVAARAKTSKTVIYRRWPNRAELVLAAMRARGPVLSGEVPNTGTLRGDVLALLQRVAQRSQEMGMETIHGLIAEVFGNNAIPSFFFQGGQVGREAMHIILQRAAERGEVSLDKITSRITSLPVDLMRHELFTTHEPLSETTIVEIVDDIFLPLVRD